MIRVYVWRGFKTGTWYVDVYLYPGAGASMKDSKQFKTFEEARAYLNGNEERSALHRMQSRNNGDGVCYDPASTGVLSDTVVSSGRLTRSR